jgi:hypothetical protein
MATGLHYRHVVFEWPKNNGTVFSVDRARVLSLSGHTELIMQ